MRSPFLMGSMAKTPLPWIGDRRASILCLLVLGMPERRRKGSALSRTTRADANHRRPNGFGREFSTHRARRHRRGSDLGRDVFLPFATGRGSATQLRPTPPPQARRPGLSALSLKRTISVRIDIQPDSASGGFEPTPMLRVTKLTDYATVVLTVLAAE